MDKPENKAECCSGHENESACRNNYFDGKRLTTDSFRVEQRYLLERRRLLNRAIHGWGVVYGFAITADEGRLTIGPGLALDACGRELLQPAALQVRVEDLIRDDKDVQSADESTCWLLCAHYAEKSSGPSTVVDACRCEHTEYERICETVRYSLQRIDCRKCCDDFDCELACDCGTGPCCEHYLESTKPKRGGCRCLCDHLTGLDPGFETCPLRKVDDPCGGYVEIDRKHSVPLACVKLTGSGYDRRSFGGDVDPCGPRRLVKRNDLLFDLLRGCDCTRICEISWAEWHRREMSFDDFSRLLGPERYGQGEYVTDLHVKFSRRVRKETVLPDCFAITVMSGEREGGWWQVFRVPIVRVELDAAGEEATLVVDGAWVEDGVRGRRSVFIGYETEVEIEIRGDFIVDCNGQTVDANAVGLRAAPTGNGTPGGTFVSSFRVAPREKGSYKGASS